MRTVKSKRSRTSRTKVGLMRCRREYERLKKQLRRMGFVCLGSITKRWLPCGKSSCVCHRDRRRRHGPYYYWTRKLAGRTEGRMLPESLVRLYREGIQNHRRLDVIIKKMREVSLLAFQAAKSDSPTGRD